MHHVAILYLLLQETQRSLLCPHYGSIHCSGVQQSWCPFFLFFFVLLWIILVMQVERWKTSTPTQKHPFPLSCAVYSGGCSQKQIYIFQNLEAKTLFGWQLFQMGTWCYFSVSSSLWFYSTFCQFFSNHSREKIVFSGLPAVFPATPGSCGHLFSDQIIMPVYHEGIGTKYILKNVFEYCYSKWCKMHLLVINIWVLDAKSIYFRINLHGPFIFDLTPFANTDWSMHLCMFTLEKQSNKMQTCAVC